MLLLLAACCLCLLGPLPALAAGGPETTPYTEFLLDRITKRVKVWGHASPHHPRLLCFIMTTSKRTEQATASFNTWGQRCDHFVAFTNTPQAHMEQWMHPYPGFLHEAKPNASAAAVVAPPRYETEDGDVSVQKIAATWQYVQEEYGSLADFFFMGYDDTYVIVENLRRSLVTLSVSGPVDPVSQPLFMGRRFKFTVEGSPLSGTTFNLGAAGYVLNTKALDVLATSIVTRACDSEAAAVYADVWISNCLKTNNIFPSDTRDAAGADRYHPLTPREMFETAKPLWYSGATADFQPKEGEDGVSKETITFHDLPAQVMMAVDKALYAQLATSMGGKDVTIPKKMPWSPDAPGATPQPPAGWAAADKPASSTPSAAPPSAAPSKEKSVLDPKPAAAAPTGPAAAAAAASAMGSDASPFAAGAGSGRDWHGKFQNSQRDLVRARMHDTLMANGKSRNVDDIKATPLFNKYEDHVYSTASSLHDYYEKIAEKMVEIKGAWSSANSAPAPAATGKK